MNEQSYNTKRSASDTNLYLQCFRLLGSTTRFEIMCALEHTSGMCVNEIADDIDATHSATSHQLNKLANAGVVKATASGKTRCYDFADTPIAKQIRAFLHQCE